MPSGGQTTSSSHDKTHPSPYRYMGLPYAKLTNNAIATLPGTLDVISFSANHFAEPLPFQQAVGKGSENVPTRRYFSHSDLSKKIAPVTNTGAVPKSARPSPPLALSDPVYFCRRANPKLAAVGCYDTLSNPSTAVSSAGPSRTPTLASGSASPLQSPSATSLNKALRQDSLVSLVSLSDACPLLAGPVHFRRQIASTEVIRADDREVAQLLRDRGVDPAQVSRTDRTILWHLMQCTGINCGGSLSVFIANSLRWLGSIDEKDKFKMTADTFIDWLRGKQEGRRLSQSLSIGKAGKAPSIPAPAASSGTEGEDKECACGPNSHDIWCDICCLLRSRGMSEDGLKREDIAHLMLQPGDKRAEALDTLSATQSSSGSDGARHSTPVNRTVTAAPPVRLRTSIFEPRSSDVRDYAHPRPEVRAPPNWLKPKAKLDHPEWLDLKSNPSLLPYQTSRGFNKSGQPRSSAPAEASRQAAQALAAPIAPATPAAAGKKSVKSSLGGLFSGYVRPRDNKERLIANKEPEVNALGSKIIS